MDTATHGEMQENPDSSKNISNGSDNQHLIVSGSRERKVPALFRESYLADVPRKELHIKIKPKASKVVGAAKSVKAEPVPEETFTDKSTHMLRDRKRKISSLDNAEVGRVEDVQPKETVATMKESKQDLMEESLIKETFRRGGQRKFATIVSNLNKPKAFKDQSNAYNQSARESTSIITDWNSDKVEMLGKLCKVYWDGEKEWFYARIINFDPVAKRYFVYYFADSTAEWVDLNKECMLIADRFVHAKVSRTTAFWPAMVYEPANETARKALSLKTGYNENAVFVEFFSTTDAAESEYAFVQSSFIKEFTDSDSIVNSRASKKLIVAMDAVIAEKQAIDGAREEAFNTTRANLLRALYGEELVGMRVRARAAVITDNKVTDPNPSFYCAGTIKKYCPLLNKHFIVFDEESLQPRWVDCAIDESIECLFDPNKTTNNGDESQQANVGEEMQENQESSMEVDGVDNAAANSESDTDNDMEEEAAERKPCSLCERSCTLDECGLKCRVCGIFCHDYCIPEEGFNPMNAVTKLKNPHWVCWNCSDCANCAVTLYNRRLIYWSSKKQVPKGHEKTLLLCGWCLRHYKQTQEYCIICYKLYVYQVFAAPTVSSEHSKKIEEGDNEAPSYAADQKMIQCHECDRWIHARCEGIDDNQFDSITNGSHPIWGDEYFCPLCRNEICAQIMRQLFYLDTSKFFHHPVSEAVAANYYDIIHSPMDLSTMRDRANRGYYKSAHPLRQDAELICFNALTFNRPGDPVWNAAKAYFTRVQEVFEKSSRKTTMSSMGKDCLNLIEAHRAAKAKEAEAKRMAEEANLQDAQPIDERDGEVKSMSNPSEKCNMTSTMDTSENIVISINQVESKQPESYATNRILTMGGEEAWYMSFADQCFACGAGHVVNHSLFCVDCGEMFHDFCAGADCSRMTVSDQWSWRCVNCKICELCHSSKANDAETLVLCEQCDRAYHIACLFPTLDSVPDYALVCGSCLKCDSCGSVENKALWGNCANLCWPCSEAKLLPATIVNSNDNKLDSRMEVVREEKIMQQIAGIQRERRRRRDLETTEAINEVQRTIALKERDHFFPAMLTINLALAQLQRNPLRTSINAIYHNDEAWRKFLLSNNAGFNVRQAARARRSIGFFRRRIRSFDPVTENINTTATFSLSPTGLQRVAQSAAALSFVTDQLVPKQSTVRFSYELYDALHASLRCVLNNESTGVRFGFSLQAANPNRGETLPVNFLEVLMKNREAFKQYYPFEDLQELVNKINTTSSALTSSQGTSEIMQLVAALRERVLLMRNNYVKEALKILSIESSTPAAGPSTSSNEGFAEPVGNETTRRSLLSFNRHDCLMKTLSRYNAHTQTYEEVKHFDNNERGVAEQIKTIIINATQCADFKRFCAVLYELQVRVERYFDHQERLCESKAASDELIAAVQNDFNNRFSFAVLRQALQVPADENGRDSSEVIVNGESTMENLNRLVDATNEAKSKTSSASNLPQPMLGWATIREDNDKNGSNKLASSVPWANQRVCCFCHRNSDDHPLLGRILPFPDINKYVHSNCMYWCEESRVTDAGIFEKSIVAKDANMRLRCCLCEKPGASVVCLHNKSCRNTYHLHCAIATQCILLKRKKDWATPRRSDHSSEMTDRSAEGLARHGYLEKFMLCASHAINMYEYPYYELWSPGDSNRFLALDCKAETTEKQLSAASEILSSTKSDKVIRFGSITIWSLGIVPVGYVATAQGLHGFSSPDQLYPLHFRSTRIFWSSVSPHERATYTFDILCLKDLDFVYTNEQMDVIFEQLFDHDTRLDNVVAKENGEEKNDHIGAIDAESFNGPIFRVVASDNPTQPQFARSITALHQRLLDRVAACRSSALSQLGHHERDSRYAYGLTPEQFFGIGLPVVRRALEQSIEAVQCMLLLDEKERYRPTTRLPTAKEISIAQLKLNRLDGADLIAEKRAESCARAEPIGDNGQSQPKPVRKVLTKVADSTDIIAPPTASNNNEPVILDDEERREMELSIAEAERRRQRFLTMRQEYIRDPERKLDVKRSRIHGWGLFAKVNFHQDDVIIEYVGEIVRQAVADRREVLYEEEGVGSCYLFRLDKQEIVDATRIGGIARFINHSCEPCAYARVITCRKSATAAAPDGSQSLHANDATTQPGEEEEKHIVILALRDIDAGEEITYDYKFPVEDKKLRCYCGASRCSGSMN